MLDDKDKFEPRFTVWMVEDFRLQIENFFHHRLTGYSRKQSFVLRCKWLRDKLVRLQQNFDAELREMSVFN